ncbi:MAG: hypothetical protein R3241_07605 [Rheinheimera sp.]|nr:hypothetical protein [Rheinheimera sp.]
MQTPPLSDAPWWHSQQLQPDACRHYRIGPLHIYLQRQPGQWLLAHEYSPHDKAAVKSSNVKMIPAHLTSQRYLFGQSPAEYRLVPRLLDRPVVVKTLQPVNLPPNQHTTFYISSPLCVQLMLQQPELLLQEIMVQRLSDTWFGPSTQIGELCYADKTHARHSRQELPLRPHRAVTPVTIHNKSLQMLTIDKLSIPVPFLALYALPDGSLWTDPVTLQHEGLQALAHFTTGKLSAAEAAGAQLISPARIKAEKHGLFRAFTDIFTD